MSRWVRTAVWERPSHIPLLLRDYRQTGIGAMTRAMNADRHDRIDHTLAATEAPVLIVRGRHDHISPRRWALELAGAARHGQAQTHCSPGLTWCPSPTPMRWPGASKPFSATLLPRVADS